MPPPLAPALIAAGGALAGGIGNAWSQGNMNKKSRQFSRDMYSLQKKDNLEFWNLQNSYNSPQSQMSRFQEAGLNPHLIYGQGNSGNAGGIQTPDVQTPQFRSPEWGNAIAGASTAYLSSIYDLDIKAAQADNLRAQNDTIHQETLLKEAQRLATQTGTQKTQFELDFENEFRDYSAEARRLGVKETSQRIDLSAKDYALRAAQTSSTVQEAAERMLTMQEQRATMQLGQKNTRLDMQVKRQEMERTRQNIKLLKQQGILNDLDIQLKKAGIMPSDPLWARITGRLLESAINNPSPFVPSQKELERYGNKY